MTTTAGPQAPPLRASLLGPARLSVGDRPLPDDAWPRRGARSLLLLLLISPGYRLPRERILDRLWPAAHPDAAEAALRKAVHALRRVLEPGLTDGRASRYVEAVADTVALRSAAECWVDAEAFEVALTAAAAAPPPAQQARLREALALYRGHLLDDEPAADWADARREDLRNARRRAVLTLAGLELQGGDPLAAVPPLEALLADEPTDEAALRALVRALAAGGQREAALVRYERAVGALRAELGVEPSEETRAVAAEIRAAPAPSAMPSLPPRRVAVLPAPPNPLIGRARELEAVLDLLWRKETRLVTLTGPGGIGKTRLALEVAAQAAPDFAGGVCFVPLAPIRDHRLVLPAVARALGVEEIPGRPIDERLHAALRDAELLLVLDNVEQVIGAAPAIAELLTNCPSLKVLVTSREPLRVQAERQFPTPPLALPPPDRRSPPAALARYDAVALFVERARAVKPDFALSAASLPAVAEICARLDGLPLAIELAAARAKVLPLETLSSWMGQRLSLLTEGPRDLPARLRAMRDAIAWSHDLLMPPEQALFRRLAVCAGGFSLAAAEWAMGHGEWGMGGDARPSPITHSPSPITLDRLASLVDKSLVQRMERAGEARFAMLETIREYGLECLTASGEEDATRRAHAAHYLALAERAEPLLVGTEQAAWLDRLEAEHDNLRAALGWAGARSDAATALRLSGALWRFWMIRGYLIEGRGHLERALSLPGAEAPSAQRATALARAGDLTRRCGDLAGADGRFRESLSIWRQLGDPRQEAVIHTELGRLALAVRDYAAARRYLERGLAVQRQLGDRPWLAQSLLCLGRVAHHQGDNDQARRLADESLTHYRELNDKVGIEWGLHSLIHYAIDQNDLVSARAALEEALAISANLGDDWGVTALLEAGAALAAALGQPARALRLAGAAAALREPIGVPLPPDWRGDLDRQLAPARQALSAAEAAAAWAEGRALPVECAIGAALSPDPT